jgi:hypothetical protein
VGTVRGAQLVGLPYGVSVELTGRGADETLQRYTLAALDAAVSDCAPAARPLPRAAQGAA